MGVTEKRKEYLYAYHKENLKRIPLDVSKSVYEEIKAHAETTGTSVNGFIKRAIDETMARDKAAQAGSESETGHKPGPGAES